MVYFPRFRAQKCSGKVMGKVFEILRLEEENPLKARRQHIQTLNKRAALLNDKYFRYLHFISEDTNLKIELPQNHRWVNGLETNDNGSSFICNMPTEEIYTTPLKKV